MEERISVVIPIYGVERWLRPCIDSVRNQTYQNLEIILVDDGSRDRCPGICDEYARLDPRIQVIHQKNRGITAARKAGIDLSSGRYIACIDGDDQIAPRMLEQMYRALAACDGDIAVATLSLVRDDGTRCGSYSPSREKKGNVLTGMEALERLEEVDISWTVIANKLIRREIWQYASQPFGKWHEDEFMIHELLYASRTVVCVPEAFYLYIQREGSVMADMNLGKKLCKVEAYGERLSFFLDKGIEDLLFRQDRLTLWEIEGVHRMRPRGSHKEEFQRLMDRYAGLHKQVTDRVDYPFLKRIQVALYLWLYRF